MEPSFSPQSLLPQPDRAALLVIDVQERLAAAMQPEEMETVTRNIVILAKTIHEFGLPVFVSEQYTKGLGPTLADICAALPDGTTPIEKMAFSCCGEEAFAPVMRDLSDRDVIVCGMETHVCVLQTVLDLLQEGKRVFVAADAVCSRSAMNRQIGIDLMRQAGAVIGSTEIFVFGLQRTAGTDRFKRISKLVK